VRRSDYGSNGKLKFLERIAILAIFEAILGMAILVAQIPAIYKTFNALEMAI
jgi:hypothetical protein